MKTTAKRSTVVRAIEAVNREQGYQISLNRDDQCGKWYNFTLSSPSGIPGSRYSATGHRLPKASWHAHGYIFEKIFEMEPAAVIWSKGKKYQAGFKWEDRRIATDYALYDGFAKYAYLSETSIL